MDVAVLVAEVTGATAVPPSNDTEVAEGRIALRSQR